MTSALVTGASSGIGEELARELARRGYDLILIGRRKARLDALAAELSRAHSIAAQVWQEDLSDLAAPARIERRLVESKLPLHLLVNNAGVGSLGLFRDADPEAEASMLLLNVHALALLTRLLLPHLIASKGTGILNVASTAAFQPVPRMASYAASKAYVLSFSQALGDELAPLGIQVTALCPGPTRTAFVAQAGVSEARLFQSARLARAEDVARAGLDGLMRGRAVVVPGLKNRLLDLMVRFVPRAALVRVSRSLTDSVTSSPRLRA